MYALLALCRALVDAWRTSQWEQPQQSPLIPWHTVIEGGHSE